MFETVNEIVEDIISKMTDEDKKATVEYIGCPTAHSTLGRFIRNDYGLWQNPEKLAEDCLQNHPAEATATRCMWDGYGWEYEEKDLILGQVHADDISGIIMDELEKRLIDEQSSKLQD